jgi:hypothetical protein
VSVDPVPILPSGHDLLEGELVLAWDVLQLARLGPKAPALAWLDTAPAQPKYGPGQSPPCRLGSGLAWLRPRLLAAISDLMLDGVDASPGLVVSLAHG